MLKKSSPSQNGIVSFFAQLPSSSLFTISYIGFSSFSFVIFIRILSSSLTRSFYSFNTASTASVFLPVLPMSLLRLEVR